MASAEDLDGQPATGTLKRAIQKESPEPSCLSMKSDRSVDHPPGFSSGVSSADVRAIQKESPEPSCLSMKSDRSIDHPPGFSLGVSSADVSHRQKESNSTTDKKQLDSIFNDLEDKIISLMKNKLKRFKRLLSLDYPAFSDREEEDEGQIGEGVLKITLTTLRMMNQTDLANMLQTKLISAYQQKLKFRLKQKYQRVIEGISNQRNSTLLNEIYTELYITEGGSEDVNNEHEVRQIDTANRRSETQESPIKCNDIFRPLPGRDKHIRTVLTKGIAGIGKTVSVQKFILDWAEGKANQDIHFIFPLPYRELNLVKQKNISLMELLHQFFTEMKELKSIDFNDFKIMIIFDGLDECRLPLDFQNNNILWDVTDSASVDVLLTNLTMGQLLPSALLWITSRPAAANQIPPECVDQLTEIRGFKDPQKDMYFRKRITDQSLANRIITHIKSFRSLYIMCHIPVFCWISSTVLERMLGEAESAEIPKTLTQMFTYFLIFQTNLKTQKYDGKYEVDLHQARKSILALGKLAFEQLEKQRLIFYEEDLRECGIDVREASVYSGVCTQIFREEFGLYLGKVFSFVHLSIQEFLAAVFKFLVFDQDKENETTMTDLLKTEVDKALQSEKGHLDLFLRFLLGLSLESNQILLQGLLTQTGSSSHSKQDIVDYIKMKIREIPSSEKSINLFHCLNELNDHSLVQEVQTYLRKTGFSRLSGVKLSPAHWSALVFVLLNSKEELDEFKLSKYHRSEQCLLRLLQVIKASRKADLSECNLTGQICSSLASALSSNDSCLIGLNLSLNKLKDSGMKILSDGLQNPHCKLETLKLENCGIGEEGCAALISALKSNPSHLRDLNLTWNKPGDAVKLLSGLLKDPHCKLEKLMLWNCNIREEGCAALASALISNPSHLRELNLNCNEPGEGVKLLSDLLKLPHCKLKKLELWNCNIREEGCTALASALISNPSHLRELNLAGNKPGDSGVKLLSDLLKHPQCKLEKLDLCNCGIEEEGCAALISALRSNPSQLKDLSLKWNIPGDSAVKMLSDLKDDPHCKLDNLDM